MSFLSKKIEESTGSQWSVSAGTHKAVIIGLIDHGEEQRNSKKGTTYAVQTGEILFAVEDTNPNGNHKVIGSYKMDFTFNDTKLKQWVDGAKWKFTELGELMKLPCTIEVAEATSKAGKKFMKVAKVSVGTGFKAKGKIELPSFYAESEGEVHLIPGAFISEKKESSSKVKSKDVASEEIELSDAPF